MKQYLLLVVFGTIVCWAAWALVLFFIDPFVSGFIGLTSFYGTLFLALLGTFGLVGYAVRRAVSRDPVVFHHIGVSVRQAVLLAVVVVGALLLRGTGFYTWWNLLILVAGCTMLEFFFLTREST